MAGEDPLLDILGKLKLRVARLAAEHPIERIDLDAIDDVPRALAFAPDGALLIGTAAGRLLRIELGRE